MSKKLIQFAFILYIALLLYLTIFSRRIYLLSFDLHNEAHVERLLWLYTHVPNWKPFDSINMYMSISSFRNIEFLYNVIGNIIAFVPFTFLGGFIFQRKYTSFLLAFLTTWSIEFSQLLLVCGSFDIDDVILNLMGAILGLLLYQLVALISKQVKSYQERIS